ncbi:MAG: D-aminoacylase [Firmicutes bacterium]|nr:D-aminoacylase [Bacillota bacterium]MCL5040465.1 D-aminoacylase [Bacillota bacterium]
MYQLVIRNGRVIDGAGNPWFYADVAIAEGKVAAIGRITGAAEREIDARGLAVAPGFIDLHSHSDFTLLLDPLAQSKVRQGVTTEVVGNCGGWAAPLAGSSLTVAQEMIHRYDPSFAITWGSMGEYLQTLERRRPAVNVAALVGHGTVRASVMGYEQRPPSPQEMQQMRTLVEESLDQGAFGLSTGLYYAPGSYAATDEIIELAQVVAEGGGLYSSHIRDESNYNIGVVSAVKEALEIGRRSGVRVEVSHLKALGPVVWGKGRELLRLINQAREEGVDAAADAYPYAASGTSLIGALIPRWAQEGGRAGLLEKLGDPGNREKLLTAVVENLERRGGAERLHVSALPDRPDLEGKNLAEVAQALGISPGQAVLNLLEKGDVPLVSFVMDERDVENILAAPFISIVSDGYALSAEGLLAVGKPHPRSFGTFPRALNLARERQLFRPEEAVRKMTSLPAARLGLEGRGLLKEGYWADLVIFDDRSVKDRATFLNPLQYPAGIYAVLVNGEIVVQEGQHTGRRSGKVLRRGKR